LVARGRVLERELLVLDDVVVLRRDEDVHRSADRERLVVGLSVGCIGGTTDDDGERGERKSDEGARE
jgi:hypothetical protein